MTGMTSGAAAPLLMAAFRLESQWDLYRQSELLKATHMYFRWLHSSRRMENILRTAGDETGKGENKHLGDNKP